jgi:hypothetical protein
LEGGSPSVAGAKCTGIANGEAFAWPVQRINPPVFIERSARAAPYFIADLSLAVQKKKTATSGVQRTGGKAKSKIVTHIGSTFPASISN